MFCLNLTFTFAFRLQTYDGFFLKMDSKDVQPVLTFAEGTDFTIIDLGKNIVALKDRNSDLTMDVPVNSNKPNGYKIHRGVNQQFQIEKMLHTNKIAIIFNRDGKDTYLEKSGGFMRFSDQGIKVDQLFEITLEDPKVVAMKKAQAKEEIKEDIKEELTVLRNKFKRDTECLKTFINREEMEKELGCLKKRQTNQSTKDKNNENMYKDIGKVKSEYRDQLDKSVIDEYENNDAFEHYKKHSSNDQNQFNELHNPGTHSVEKALKVQN